MGLDLEVSPRTLPLIRYDLAYGGAFYAYVKSGQIELDLTPANYSRIIHFGTKLNGR